jgi:hypothetical protein
LNVRNSNITFWLFYRVLVLTNFAIIWSVIQTLIRGYCTYQSARLGCSWKSIDLVLDASCAYELDHYLLCHLKTRVDVERALGT